MRDTFIKLFLTWVAMVAFTLVASLMFPRTSNAYLGTVLDNLAAGSGGTIVGNWDFTGDVSCTGSATLGDSATDNVYVNGPASFNANVTLGNASADVVTVTGIASFTPAATFNGDAVLGSNRWFRGSDADSGIQMTNSDMDMSIVENGSQRILVRND